MAAEPRFKLNRNAGVDTLHVEHPWEECNVDDATDVQLVDPLTAAVLIEKGDARRCEHCKPEPVG